jgi:hypothetical protein
MKINAANSWLFVTLLSTTGLCASAAVRADDLDRANDAVVKAEQLIQKIQGGQEIQPPQNSPLGSNPWGGKSAFFNPGRVGTSVTSAIRKAAEAVRDAKGDDAKSAAQKKLTELLSNCYDDDMVQREQELKQIEERLTKLRELLDRRRTKKQEIIDLQTKVALNEAEGLGFYDGERSAKGGASSFSLVMPRIDSNDSAVGAPAPPQVPAAPPAPAAPKAISR